MNSPRAKAALLCATGFLTAAAAIRFFGAVWPPAVSKTGIVLGVVAGLCQAVGAHGVLRSIPLELHIGRWASLAVGAVMLAMLISAGVVGGRDLDLKIAGRLLILGAFTGVQFLAAHVSRVRSEPFSP